MPLVTKLFDKDGNPVRGFEDVSLTSSSPERLTLSGAIAFVKPPYFLQRLGTAMAVRAHANGADHANDWQRTSTGVIYADLKGRLVRLYDDILDREKNLAFAFAQQSYDAHNSTPFRELKITRDNPLVQAAMKRAVKDGRILEVPEENSLELSVRASKTGSQFGKHFKRIVGPVAEDYSNWLHDEHKRSVGYDRLLGEGNLDGVDLDKYVVFRTAGLDGSTYYVDSSVYSIDFIGSGRARGEAHGAQKISSGSKGRRKVHSR